MADPVKVREAIAALREGMGPDYWEPGAEVVWAADIEVVCSELEAAQAEVSRQRDLINELRCRPRKE